MSRVSICIITYKRPVELGKLLDSLANLSFKKNQAPEVEVVIVDNDPDLSAYKHKDQYSIKSKHAVVWGFEPQAGIPQARNKTLELVSEESDYIAFIDDDEVADEWWLDELLHVQTNYGADVVRGPVIPLFTQDTPQWISKGSFFNRPRFQTGQNCTFAATNNVLVKKEVFTRMESHFDKSLALTGGEDKEFFQRVSRSGFSIVWCDEALVYEHIPMERANAKWILQRGYRVGNTDGLCALSSESSFIARLKLIAKSFASLILHIFFLPISAALGKRILVKTCCSIYRSAGTLSGILGMKYEEYRRL